MKLNPSLLTSLLVLAAAVACDLAPTDDDGMPLAEGAEDDDDGGTSEPGDDASNPNGDDDDDDDDSGESDDDTDDDDESGTDEVPEFDNEFDEASSALAGMWFVCTVSEGDYYNVQFLESAEVRATDEDGQTHVGMYTVEAEQVTLSFPQLDFVESSIAHEIEADVLATFTLPSLACHATALRDVATYESEVVQCPSIKHIPGVSYEDNELHFGNDGGVKRRRWRELTAANDTLYSEVYGVYLTFGDQVIMLFGDGDEGERVLTGVVTEDGLYVEQLEPETGACV